MIERKQRRSCVSQLVIIYIYLFTFQSGDETQRILRDAAVWAVTFSKSTLVVTDWNDMLSFYNVQGQQLLKERNIGNQQIIDTS